MDKTKKTVRTRDFIISTDGLLFASTNYIHPEDRIICFLRYIPDENGDREKDGIRYSKVLKKLMHTLGKITQITYTSVTLQT